MPKQALPSNEELLELSAIVHSYLEDVIVKLDDVYEIAVDKWGVKDKRSEILLELWAKAEDAGMAIKRIEQRNG